MKLFVTGISTNVGKTIASAIIVKALNANYWKPIQAGNLKNSDSKFINSIINEDKMLIFESSYSFTTPVSPHLAAENDNVVIDLSNIIEPKTSNHLVIEGAGGIFVPLNQTHFIIDLIKPDYKVIVVSRHYLGSINHTLLTIEVLKNKGINVAGIIFNGDENKSTESIILQKTDLKFIGRIESEPYFDENVIKYYAEIFRNNLINLQ